MKTVAILFDCDGTLVDTETLCAVTDIDILARYDIHYASPEEFLHEFIGYGHPEILSTLNARHGVNITLPAWKEEFMRRNSAKMESDMRYFPESVDFVRGLAARGVPMAVCSNGYRDLVLQELDVAGYGDALPPSRVIAIEDVANPKPHPEMYLKAAAMLGVAPCDCIVVEDSATGTRAGVAAGMKVVGYTGFAHDAGQAENALKNAGCFSVISDLSTLEGLIT